MEAIFSEIHIVLVNIRKARSYSRAYRYSVTSVSYRKERGAFDRTEFE